MRFILLLVMLLSPALYAKSIQSLVDEDWVEVKTPNFHIISDGSEERAKAYASDLEAFRALVPFILKLEMKEDVPPFTVFAIEGGSNFRALGLDLSTAGIFFSHLNEDFAVANLRGYDLRGRGDNFARQVLLHEYVHFLMRNATAEYYYPVWYTEGTADYFSTLVIDGVSVRYGLMSEMRFHSIDFSDNVPVEWVFNVTKYPEHRQKNSRFYAYSWMINHYFSQDGAFLEKNKEYLELWRNGVSADEAFPQAYGMTYAEFGRVLKEMYSKRKYWRKYRYKQITLSKPLDAQIDLSREMDPHQVAYHLGRLQLYRSALQGENQDEEKASGYELMQYVMESDPANISAQTFIWRHDIQEGGATEQLGAEISAFYAKHSKSPEVSVAYGDWLLREAGTLVEAKDNEEAAAAIKAARGKYRRAIYYNGMQLDAYAGVARIYRDYGILFTTEEDLGEAISVNLELAYKLDYPLYRYNLALLYEQQGDVAEAGEQYQQVLRSWDATLAEKASQQLVRLAALQENTVTP